MKNILITGYYGFANIGDEAVLEEIIHNLRQVIPSVNITVISNSPLETGAAYGVKSINRTFKALRKALRKADLFILGGGSLLQNVTSTKSLLFYLLQILAARFAGRRVFLYAQGIGPINGRFSRFITVSCLKKCAGITLRDQESAAFLEEIGLKKKLTVTIDPVLAATEKELPPPLPTGKKLGVALRHWQNPDIPEIAKGLDTLANEGWTIVLLPFHEPDDRELALAVMDKMSQKVFLLETTLAPDTMCAAIGQMQALVGMRLHSLIMAAASGVPFTAISYDPKISSFCHSLGLEPACTCQSFAAEALVKGVRAMDEASLQLKTLFSEKKVQWRKLALANAIIAREASFGIKDFSLEEALLEVEIAESRLGKSGQVG